MSAAGSENTKHATDPADGFVATKLAASLTVNDLATSLAWYRDVLGFVVTQEHQRDGKLAAISLAAGDVQLLIGQDDFAKGRDRVKGLGFSLQLTTTQNIDGVAARIKAHGGRLESEPMDLPWGVRAFRLVDPDGFRFVISSPHPGR
jgi:lactoylglutathione lyase